MTTAIAQPPEGFALKPYAWTLLAVLALGWGPALLAYCAAAFAALNGCTIGADAATPCLVLGRDWSPMLHGLAGLAGIASAMLPLAILLLVVWAVALCLSVLAWRRRGAGAASRKLEIRFAWYGLALLAILALGYATLAGWLPGPALIAVVFAGAFWTLSLAFALLGRLRRS